MSKNTESCITFFLISLALVYEILVFQDHAVDMYFCAVLLPLCNSITRQAIVLEQRFPMWGTFKFGNGRDM